MQARRANLTVVYDNKDITADLQPHLKAWHYTDNMSGESDDLQITLQDREQRWIGVWFPDKGATLRASVNRLNWEWDGQVQALDLGQFELDEIEVSYPPSEVILKALSIPEGSASLRGEPKNKAWEDTTLKKIAGAIAGDNGMSLFFDSDYDPSFDRLEQTEQTDLEFLQKQCIDAGLSLKIAEKKIIIFDDAKYEEAAPVATIDRLTSNIISYMGKTTLDGVYKACKVEYTNAKTKKTYTHTFNAPNAPATGKTLHINQRVISVGEAALLAKRKLRQENCKETQFSLTLPGDTRFLAALTLQLKNFGKFDGKYIITQAVHRGSAYQTALQLRRCLEGY